MATIGGTDRHSLMDSFSSMPPELYANLIKLTKNQLGAAQDEKWARVAELFSKILRRPLDVTGDERRTRFIKVAYIDQARVLRSGGNTRIPRVVLWEVHVSTDGLEAEGGPDRSDPVQAFARKVQAQISAKPSHLQGLQADLYFAGAELGAERAGQERLKEYLLVYCDKVYAVPKTDPPTLQRYKAYFGALRDMILGDPVLYTDLCRSLRGLFLSDGEVRSPQLYQHLVLLRSLPECLAVACDNLAGGPGFKADAASGYAEVANSTWELLDLLEDLHRNSNEKDNAAVIYSVINALEWLSYLAPSMYGVQISPSKKPLQQALVGRLVRYIVGDYNLAIRLEAAWALGWASVSSIEIAALVPKQLPPNAIRMLNSDILRYVAGGAYLRASFTLASFGPARFTSGAEKIPAGGFITQVAEATAQSKILADARKAASTVVYRELGEIVGVAIRIPAIVVAAAALLLAINLAIALVPMDRHFFLALLLGPPSLLLVAAAALFTVQWGRTHRWLLAIVWTGILAVWVVVGSIIGDFKALAQISGILEAVLKWLQSHL